MPFPFALSRMILLSLSVIALHEKTGGGFQILAICFGIISLVTILGCLCHQIASRDGETSNATNVAMFGFCGLLGFALAVTLTVHARRDRGVGLCNDFAKAVSPCVPAGVQLGMAYVSPSLALMGLVISWIDKFPGAVQVTPRYPITKAPSSHFAVYAHDLDENYTRPPVKISSRPGNNPKWSDVPLHC